MRHTVSDRGGHLKLRHCSSLTLIALLAAPAAHASLFSGDTLDAVANVLAWIVLFIAPILAIAVFLMVHILPEKVAEKRRHPQLGAIKTLCLLSLVFGGMLWPIAWLWAYSKPVLHQIAYGTDVAEPEGESASATAAGQGAGESMSSRTSAQERDRGDQEA